MLLLQVRRGLAGPDPARPTARASGAPVVILLRVLDAGQPNQDTPTLYAQVLVPACTISHTPPHLTTTCPQAFFPPARHKGMYSDVIYCSTCPCRTHLNPSHSTHFSLCGACIMSTHKRRICPCLALPCMSAQRPGPPAGRTPFHIIPCLAAPQISFDLPLIYPARCIV